MSRSRTQRGATGFDPSVRLVTNHPKNCNPGFFGQFSREMLEDAAKFSGGAVAGIARSRLLGKRIVVTRGRQLLFRGGALRIIRGGMRLESLVLSCQLLTAERDVFLLLRQLQERP